MVISGWGLFGTPAVGEQQTAATRPILSFGRFNISEKLITLRNLLSKTPALQPFVRGTDKNIILTRFIRHCYIFP